MSQSRDAERHWPQSQPERPPTALENVRDGLSSMFSGRSRVGRPRDSVPESPKTPRLPLGLPSTRLVLPFLSRASTDSRRSLHRRSESSRSDRLPFNIPRSRPETPETPPRDIPQLRPLPRRHSTRRFVGVDPAELHLAELAEAGRRRRRRNTRTNRMCGPQIKNKKIRAKIISCVVSGLFLALVLTVYLALALSNRTESQEFHVLLILIILITTIFFCHALIRLCMMIIHPPDASDMERQNLPSMIGPGGYANPSMPIRVALARDEEAAGIESEATKMPPPAYGLWRESVRVDPNRIFWQRNEAAALERQNSTGPTAGRPSTNRPPSYISEDGVDYVIEAAPRSIAPTTDVPLPPHPSERGRPWPRS